MTDRRGNAEVVARIQIAGAAICALVLWQGRSDWRVVVSVPALLTVHVVFGRFAHPWWERSRPGGAADLVVHGVHAGLNVLQAHIAGWSLSAWLLVPYTVFSAAGQHDRESRTLLAMTTAMFGAVAVADAVPADTIAEVLTLTVALYWIWETRTRMLREALGALREERLKVEVAHRKLVAQERLSSLGMLAAGVAHEINNPMSFVTSNVSLLAEELPAMAADPEKLREYREDILPATIDGIARVNRVIDDLRRFARGEAGGVQELDLNEEVSAAVRIARNQTYVRCRIELDPGELPRIFGRPQEIGRVVLNLLVNAAHATPESGVVRLSTRLRDGGVVLTVADTGRGMSPETLQHVFEPFYTTGPLGEWNGLGLAVVHGIVSAHGGRIDVESSPGSGSTFTVSLPIGRRDASAPPAAASP